MMVECCAGCVWDRIMSSGQIMTPIAPVTTPAKPRPTSYRHIGIHGHTFTSATHGGNSTGNTENTVKNIAFNAIVRLA
jgi:hypothetical protein